MFPVGGGGHGKLGDLWFAMRVGVVHTVVPSE
jgi:hypothetical protein